MSTPSERLEKIVQACTPSVVKFKAIQDLHGSLLFQSFKTQPMVVREIENDIKLQAAFKDFIVEEWSKDLGVYYIRQDIVDMFRHVKYAIGLYYEQSSKRSPATKRKTDQFIKRISIDNDQALTNFLLQMFIDIRSPEFELKTTLEKQDYFESLDLMRRTYGK